jgi:succinoglycan biosynthesis protein ExoV
MNDRANPIRLAYFDLKNFGDQLNRDVVSRIFGERVSTVKNLSPTEKYKGVKLFAIMSGLSRAALTSSFDNEHQCLIFGSGAGYADFSPSRSAGLFGEFPQRKSSRFSGNASNSLPDRTGAYVIYWVRGPLTARVLGLSPDVAVADAGYMVRHCDLLSVGIQTERQVVSFMPHMTAARFAVGLKDACERLGMQYIDPAGEVTEVLRRIGRSRMLITEALHGAVVSDACRVPWIPVKSSEAVLEFKWRDFCASIGVEYRPISLRVGWRYAPRAGRSVRNLAMAPIRGIRSFVTRMRVSPDDTAYDLLIASGAKPFLSSDNTIKKIDQEIAARLERFSEEDREKSIFL